MGRDRRSGRVGLVVLASLLGSTLTACSLPTAPSAPEETLEVRSDSASAPSPVATPTASTTPSSPPSTTPSQPSSDAGSSGEPASQQVAEALRQLATLPVKGRAPRTGYDRSLFGQRWADVDRNGCDTRNDLLRRDLTDVTLKASTNGCKVLSGSLADPYSGSTVSLPDVQIDHIVSLSDAWQKGAQQWTPEQRVQFANDPVNLQATSGTINQAKSDSDAASWLPPARGYRCTFVARQIAVKAGHGLWVTTAEHDTMARVLGECGAPSVPTTIRTSDPSTHDTSAGSAGSAGSAAPLVTPAREGCDPSYPDACIPPVSVRGDLDCGDVPDRGFTVLAPDPHNFDGNHDGVGCEGP